MTYSLRFLPEVVEDALSGYAWYEAKGIGLGEEFLRVFYDAAGGIQYNPWMYQKIFRQIRRCLLRRFPYTLYFMVEDDEVLVVGLFHCARDPRKVNEELLRRGEI